MKNNNVGSLRCRCCNKELEESEFVYCEECEIHSTLDDDIEELLKNISEEYIEG